MVLQGDPTEPKPERRYQVIDIGSFDPTAFDMAMEQVGNMEERDLGGAHWRGIKAKYVVVGDKLLLVSPEKTHSALYRRFIDDDTEAGQLFSGGEADIFQKMNVSGTYETNTRRLSGSSETLETFDGLDQAESSRFRNTVLAEKLANFFVWN